MINGVRYQPSTVARKRYNPYISKRKSIIYHILSKISITRNMKYKENCVYSSFIKKINIGVFGISEEVENEYSVYKLKKKNNCKKYARKFSFYNSDGSFNCLGIILGMCSDDDYIREKSVKIFFVNFEKIIDSEDFRDLVTLLFSCSVFMYLYFALFFNFTEYTKYILSSVV